MQKRERKKVHENLVYFGIKVQKNKNKGKEDESPPL